MPWKPSDATRHKKGLKPAQREKWAAVANRELETSGNEGRAIRTANASVRARKPKGAK